MKVKDNFEEFEKAKSISIALTDMIDKRETDITIVEEWLREDDTAIDLIKKFSDENNIEKIYNDYGAIEKNRDKLIFEVNRRKKAKKQRLIVRSIISSCAAALLMISFTIYYNNQNGRDNITAYEIETPKKPTLFLSSGKSITLNADDEQIVDDKMTVNIDRNSLNYNSKTSETENNDELFHRLVIPSIQTYNVTLSDGTVVTLNANSEIRYPTVFHGETRKIYLKGEAYFKVTKSSKPFIVNVEGVDIKVYGTEFNINARITNQLYTTLISGSIGVTINEGEEFMMKPNQLSIVNLSNSTLELSNVIVSQYISWMNGDFIYEDTNIETMINDVAAWYGVEISYDTKLFNGITINAAFSRGEPLAKILKSIETITDVKFTKTDQNKYAIE